MYICLIHAHSDIDSLNELIDTMARYGVPVAVNLDKKSQISACDIDKRANLINARVNIYWGDWSQVEAELNSLIEIEATYKDYSHVVLVSGGDFPVKNPIEICDFLQDGIDYMTAASIGSEGLDWNYRLTNLYTHKGSIVLRAAYRIINDTRNGLGFPRKFPAGLKPYGGSQWWNLSRGTIRKVLTFVKSHPALLKYFRDSHCPDEIFFQTIIMNAFPGNVVNDNLRFMDFPARTRHPKNLDLSYLPEINNSNAIFARKFHPEYSRELKDALIKKIHLG